MFLSLDKAEYTFCEGMSPVPSPVSPCPVVYNMQVNIISIVLCCHYFVLCLLGLYLGVKQSKVPYRRWHSLFPMLKKANFLIF